MFLSFSKKSSKSLSKTKSFAKATRRNISIRCVIKKFVEKFLGLTVSIFSTEITARMSFPISIHCLKSPILQRISIFTKDKSKKSVNKKEKRVAFKVLQYAKKKKKAFVNFGEIDKI